MPRRPDLIGRSCVKAGASCSDSWSTRLYGLANDLCKCQPRIRRSVARCVITPAQRTGVTVDGSGGELINGVTTSVLSNQYDSLEIVSGPSQWHLLVAPGGGNKNGYGTYAGAPAVPASDGDIWGTSDGPVTRWGVLGAWQDMILGVGPVTVPGTFGTTFGAPVTAIQGGVTIFSSAASSALKLPASGSFVGAWTVDVSYRVIPYTDDSLMTQGDIRPGFFEAASGEALVFLGDGRIVHYTNWAAGTVGTIIGALKTNRAWDGFIHIRCNFDGTNCIFLESPNPVGPYRPFYSIPRATFFATDPLQFTLGNFGNARAEIIHIDESP